VRVEVVRTAARLHGAAEAGAVGLELDKDDHAARREDRCWEGAAVVVSIVA
jgi:hypothetical protein